MPGLFITLEGPEGSGKSTQLPLLAAWLTQAGYHVLETREPGGTPISECVRDLLHDPVFTEMDPRTEILLYSASRAQLVNEIIRPALAAGQVVLCDRYFDSTYAYQGYGRDLSLDDLRYITRFATEGLKPHLTLYLDVEPKVGLRRKEDGGEEMNRMDREALDFHRRVRSGYLTLAKEEPRRWEVIAADTPIETVQGALRSAVARHLRAFEGELMRE
jgi:dTMP kinase